MTIERLLMNAKALKTSMDSGSLVRVVLEKRGNEIVEQQRIQLFQGKNSRGEDIHPFYSEDVKPRGWFTTRDAARRYAEWKQTISYPYSVRRNPDAPNLYITGLFHNDLNVNFGVNSVMIVPDTAYAANIMGKYGFGMFGLSWDSWGVIFNEKGATGELITKMREKLWQ